MLETEEKAKLYNPKWEFTFNVREPCPIIAGDDGPMRVRKVVMIQRENRPVVIEVSGPHQFRPANFMRRKRYSLDGICYDLAPDWIIEAVRIAGFGRVEP